MNLSIPKGFRQLIKSEGLVTHIYPDQGNLPTIGVGHLLTKDELSSGCLTIDGKYVDYGLGITKLQCIMLMIQDVAISEDAVNEFLPVNKTQWQFDALVHFVFNIGIYAFRDSSLVRRVMVDGEHLKSIYNEFERWRYVTINGQKVESDGLIARRKKTKKLFNKGVYTI